MGVSGATLPKDKYVLKKVKVSTIDYQDTRTQMRALGEAVDQDHLDHLAAQYAESQRIDPLDLFWDGRVHKIGDGHHRTQLALNMSLAEVDARVYQGDWQDAALFACNVNDHGLARTDGGVDESVRWLCTESRWRFESDSWLGEHVGRSSDAVYRIRQKLGIPGGSERARAAIVALLQSEPDLTSKEASERLGVPLRTVQRVVSNSAGARNLASDVIARKGSGRQNDTPQSSDDPTPVDVQMQSSMGSSEAKSILGSKSCSQAGSDDFTLKSIPAEKSAASRAMHTPVTPSVNAGASNAIEEASIAVKRAWAEFRKEVEASGAELPELLDVAICKGLTAVDNLGNGATGEEVTSEWVSRVAPLMPVEKGKTGDYRGCDLDLDQNNNPPTPRCTPSEPEQPEPDAVQLSAQVTAVMNFWGGHMQKRPRQYRGDHDAVRVRREKVRTRLQRDRYTVKDLKRAIIGCSLNPHNMGENDRNKPYNDIELICRNGVKVEGFIEGFEAAYGEADPDDVLEGKVRKKGEVMSMVGNPHLSGGLSGYTGDGRPMNAQQIQALNEQRAMMALMGGE